MNQGQFYDDIAEYYDLIYADWEGSMLRHGAAIAEILDGRVPSRTRILDVSAGIGTQVLPLAALGYEVVARDVSEGAIRRLRREARQRGLEVDAGSSDMRDVSRSVSGPFDAIISFDNSLPHLLTDSDIAETLRGLSSLLSPGGIILVSVRDYEDVDRSPTSVHPYGERNRDGRHFRLSQEWTWYDVSHYRTTMLVEEQTHGSWADLVRTDTAYYAIPLARLLEIMRDSGLEARRVAESQFFQPILAAVNRAPDG